MATNAIALAPQTVGFGYYANIFGKEAKYEFVRMLRTRAFSLSVMGFPVMVYMPFGPSAHGEFGTYFIGYSRSPHTIEQMLENMFVGRPPGNYDRLLDFSRAVTGNLFFAP